MKTFGQRSINNLKGVHPTLVLLMNTAIKDSPIDFIIVQGVRTTIEQAEFYSWGRTKLNPNTGKMTKVTNADGIKNKSNHQIKADGYGHAVDLYPFFDGKVQVNYKDTIAKLKIIAEHIKKVAKSINIKIVWGGDFKSLYDPPHFQLV